MIVDSIINAFWHWVLGWAWYWQALAIACIVLICWGAVANLYRTLKEVGGWQAALGGIGLIGIVLAVLFGPRVIRKPEPDAHEHVPEGPDAAPPVGKKPKLGSKQNPIFGKR